MKLGKDSAEELRWLYKRILMEPALLIQAAGAQHITIREAYERLLVGLKDLDEEGPQ